MVVIVEIAILPELEISVNIKDMLLLCIIRMYPSQMYYIYIEKPSGLEKLIV